MPEVNSALKTNTPRNSTLTKREKQILNGIAEGNSSQEIADQFTVSKRTVDFHLANIYLKFGVKNRIQAVNKARNLNLL